MVSFCITTADFLNDGWNGSGLDMSVHISTEKEISQLTDSSARLGLAAPLGWAVFK